MLQRRGVALIYCRAHYRGPPQNFLLVGVLASMMLPLLPLLILLLGRQMEAVCRDALHLRQSHKAGVPLMVAEENVVA